MWLKTKKCVLGVTAMLIGTVTVSATNAEEQVIDRVVAQVNKQIILLSELKTRISPFEAQLQRIPDKDTRARRRKELYKQSLDQMVDEQLIVQEAETLKITVNDADLERAVSEVMRRNNLTREQLEAALAQEGKTLNEYKYTMLRPQLLRLKVMNVHVRSRIAVSDDELKARYQKNVRSLGAETRVKIRHIFIHLPPQLSEQQVADRKALAAQLRKQIDEGADFAELARKHSDDSIARSEGGDMGYITRGTLPSRIDDAVFSAKAGAVLGPLPSTRGLHIIKVIDIQESSARPFESVKNELQMQLLNEKTEKATKQWLSEMRKRSYIDVKI